MTALPARALLSFLALPGIVAFAIPVLVLRPTVRPGDVSVPGLAILALGIGLLLWCVWEFLARGRGTLAPWDPPRSLVVSGPYRVSRNPMYVAVVLIVAGWAIAFRSTVLAAYGGFLATAFHLRVVLGEEPWLARTHGEQWTTYRARVPRWILFVLALSLGTAGEATAQRYLDAVAGLQRSGPSAAPLFISP